MFIKPGNPYIPGVEFSSTDPNHPTPQAVTPEYKLELADGTTLLTIKKELPIQQLVECFTRILQAVNDAKLFTNESIAVHIIRTR